MPPPPTRRQQELEQALEEEDPNQVSPTPVTPQERQEAGLPSGVQALGESADPQLTQEQVEAGNAALEARVQEAEERQQSEAASAGITPGQAIDSPEPESGDYIPAANPAEHQFQISPDGNVLVTTPGVEGGQPSSQPLPPYIIQMATQSPQQFEQWLQGAVQNNAPFNLDPNNASMTPREAQQLVSLLRRVVRPDQQPRARGPVTPPAELTQTFATEQQLGAVDPALQARANQAGLDVQEAQDAYNVATLQVNKGSQQGFEEAALFEQAQAQEREEERRRVEQQVQSRIAAFDESLRAVQENRIDPMQVFGGDGGRVGAVLSVALGELGRALTGDDGNTAMRVINQAVERNLRAQEANMANQRAALSVEGQSLSQMHRILEDHQAARDATRSLHYSALLAQLRSVMKGLTGRRLAAAQDLEGALQRASGLAQQVAQQRGAITLQQRFSQTRPVSEGAAEGIVQQNSRRALMEGLASLGPYSTPEEVGAVVRAMSAEINQAVEDGNLSDAALLAERLTQIPNLPPEIREQAQAAAAQIEEDRQEVARRREERRRRRRQRARVRSDQGRQEGQEEASAAPRLATSDYEGFTASLDSATEAINESMEAEQFALPQGVAMTSGTNIDEVRARWDDLGPEGRREVYAQVGEINYLARTVRELERYYEDYDIGDAVGATLGDQESTRLNSMIREYVEHVIRERTGAVVSESEREDYRSRLPELTDRRMQQIFGQSNITGGMSFGTVVDHWVGFLRQRHREVNSDLFPKGMRLRTRVGGAEEFRNRLRQISEGSEAEE